MYVICIVTHAHIASLHEYNIQFVSSVRGVVDLDLDVVVVVVTDDVVVSETYANRLDISNHTNMRIRK